MFSLSSMSLFHLIQQLLFIGLGLFGIGFLIGIHEFGHFLFCKLFRIRTPSFSIGMGPRIFSRKIGDTLFTLSALPIGGYVEIAGAQEVGQGEQLEAKRDDEYSFIQKPYYQKMMVMAGGILFNILFAYIALSTLFYIGMPQTPLIYPSHATTTIKSVLEDSPAQKAGLMQGDTIIAYNKNKLDHSPEILIEEVKTHPGEQLTLEVKRDDTILTIPTQIGSQTIKDHMFGYLGIEFTIPTFSLATSIKYGIQTTHMLIGKIFSIFGQLFSRQVFDNLGGPLMVISQTVQGAAKGFKVFLLFLAFISINLAVFNIIPVPIMDGGQALFYTIEAALGRKIPDRIREYIHYACWILFLILVVFLSIRDIMRITMS